MSAIIGCPNYLPSAEIAGETLKERYEKKLDELEKERMDVEQKKAAFIKLMETMADVETKLNIKKKEFDDEMEIRKNELDQREKNIEKAKNDMIEHVKLSAIENDTQRAILQEKEKQIKNNLSTVKKSKSNLKKKVNLKSSLNAATKQTKQTI
jgi:DNA repair exonuclease SbcCD ATPase subunit